MEQLSSGRDTQYTSKNYMLKQLYPIVFLFLYVLSNVVFSRLEDTRYKYMTHLAAVS